MQDMQIGASASLLFFPTCCLGALCALAAEIGFGFNVCK